MRRMRGIGRLSAAAAIAAGLLAGPARAEAPLVPTKDGRTPVLHDRVHDRGATLLRFNRDRLHFALVLDARPAKIEERRVTLADGRTIDFRWSDRSLWIAGRKFELPFGDILLVSTRDSVRARALEFRAVRGEQLLAQVAGDAGALAWIETHGTSGAPPVRGKAEAATEPRHTTEVVEWTWRGLHALTHVLSGAPLITIVADRPVFQAGSRASFGGFDRADLRIGARAGDQVTVTRREAVFTLRDGSGPERTRTFELSKGRAFMVRGDIVRQADVAFDLGPAVADALLDRIEALPEVAAHAGGDAAP